MPPSPQEEEEEQCCQKLQEKKDNCLRILTAASKFKFSTVKLKVSFERRQWHVKERN